jgi:hypothetical protein
MNLTALLRHLAASFPGLHEPLYTSLGRDRPSLQVGCLMTHTQTQIDTADVAALRRCMAVVSHCWREGDDEVRAVLARGFLEPLSFVDGRHRRSWALAEMPPVLRQARRDACEGRWSTATTTTW